MIKPAHFTRQITEAHLSHRPVNYLDVLVSRYYRWYVFDQSLQVIHSLELRTLIMQLNCSLLFGLSKERKEKENNTNVITIFPSRSWRLFAFRAHLNPSLLHLLL